MTENKYLVPVGELKVRHPQGGYLAQAGDHVVVDSYWRKRIAEGSVVEEKAPAETSSQTSGVPAKTKPGAKSQE